MPTNMTNEAAVTELARRAVERFGRMTRPSNGRLVAEDDGLDEHQSDAANNWFGPLLVSNTPTLPKDPFQAVTSGGLHPRARADRRQP